MTMLYTACWSDRWEQLESVLRRKNSAFLFHRPTEVPPHFYPTTGREPLVTAAYLPKGPTGTDLQSSALAWIFLLFPSSLVFAGQPSEAQAEYRIPLDSIEFIESGNLLFERWFAITTTDYTYRFPYFACDEACVDEFLYDLRCKLVPATRRTRLVEGIMCGAPLELKFACAQSDELDPDERILVRFFTPHIRFVERHHCFFHREFWHPADYLAVTDRRVLWLTDRHNDRSEVGGMVARYCPMGRVSAIRIDCRGPDWELRICFTHAAPWKIPLSRGALEPASSFVDVLRACAKENSQHLNEHAGGAAKKSA